MKDPIEWAGLIVLIVLLTADWNAVGEFILRLFGR